MNRKNSLWWLLGLCLMMSASVIAFMGRNREMPMVPLLTIIMAYAAGVIVGLCYPKEPK